MENLGGEAGYALSRARARRSLLSMTRGFEAGALCSSRVECTSLHKNSKLTSVYIEYIHDKCMDVYKKLKKCTGFQWDKHNIQKNWEKHKVSPAESEQAFFNRPLRVAADICHSQEEERFYALGKTNKGRMLFIVFTIRKTLVRVISSRDMIKKKGRFMIMAKKKKIPGFKNEDAEREFWASCDSGDYIDWSTSRDILMPNLKPSLKTISIRLPEMMIEELKLIANKRDVPYQSLMKMFLVEKIEQELDK